MLMKLGTRDSFNHHEPPVFAPALLDDGRGSPEEGNSATETAVVSKPSPKDEGALRSLPLKTRINPARRRRNRDGRRRRWTRTVRPVEVGWLLGFRHRCMAVIYFDDFGIQGEELWSREEQQANYISTVPNSMLEQKQVLVLGCFPPQ